MEHGAWGTEHGAWGMGHGAPVKPLSTTGSPFGLFHGVNMGKRRGRLGEWARGRWGEGGDEE